MKMSLLQICLRNAKKLWLKQKVCLMTEALKACGIYGKEVIQKILPSEMQ